MFGLRRRGPKPAPEWSRQKMQALVVACAGVGLLLVAGLVLAVVYAFNPPKNHTAGHSAAAGMSNTAVSSTRPATPEQAAQDALAAKAMPQVDEDASHPGAVSTAQTKPPLSVPKALSVGPAQVPTGFAHTPAGALAQLAAIDKMAVESGSLTGARTVLASWGQPGGPTGSSWSVVQGLAALFDDAGLSGGGSPQLAIVLTPLMGLVKGSVGPDFVVPCVDFELDVTLDQTARGATADCQRMVWAPDRAVAAGGRWMIAPGSEPALAPSVWPDTDTAYRVGYRDLETEH